MKPSKRGGKKKQRGKSSAQTESTLVATSHGYFLGTHMNEHIPLNNALDMQRMIVSVVKEGGSIPPLFQHN